MSGKKNKKNNEKYESVPGRKVLIIVDRGILAIYLSQELYEDVDVLLADFDYQDSAELKMRHPALELLSKEVYKQTYRDLLSEYL